MSGQSIDGGSNHPLVVKLKRLNPPSELLKAVNANQGYDQFLNNIIQAIKSETANFAAHLLLNFRQSLSRLREVPRNLFTLVEFPWRRYSLRTVLDFGGIRHHAQTKMDLRHLRGCVIFTCFLEFAQLWNPPPLADFRRTRFGAALLGSSFVWNDFPAYFVGGLIGYIVLRSLVAWKPTEPVDSTS